MIDFNLLQDFMEEAYEHLEEMESSLLRMEENPDDEDILNDIFRSVHTIKGAAQFVGIERISELTHKLENLLDRLRQKELAPSMEVVDLLIAGKDRMADLARELDQHKEERSPIDDLLVQIESIDAAEQTGATPDRKPESNAPAASAAAPDPSEFNDFLDDLTEELDREDPAALLQSESFDEEYDTELYAIFIDQLQEGLTAIHRLEAELAGGGDAEAYLDRSEEAIRGMSSAANYMGYEKLTLFYSRWLENLASAREKLTVGSNVSSGASSLWVQALVEKFPEAAPSATVSPASEEIGGETADTMDLTDDEDMDAAIDDLFEELQSAGPSENPADLLTGENFKEDYDDELFGIFHSQIADSTTSLRALDAELDRSEDPLGVLDRCVEIIETLSSAANYMGYDKLTGFYSRWNEVLSSAREQARSGSRVTGGINKPWVEALLDKFSIAAAAAAPPERQEEQPTDATSEAERTNPELASAMTLLQEETIDEEQDAELFEIFMSQLKDGIAELHRLQDELSGSSDPEKPLEACGEILQRLQLAANYMGYDHLSGFYAHWQKVLASAAGQGSTGTGVFDEVILPWTHALAEKFSVPSPVPTDETASYRDSAVGDLIGDLFQETSEQDLDDLLQAEDLEEEYDAELFGIFQEQLIEGVDNLQRLTAQLVGTDDIDTVLLECSRILERMCSSAN